MTYDRNNLTRITITLPADLVEEIDRRAGGRGRSRYVAEAAHQRLRRDSIGAALRTSEGILSTDEDEDEDKAGDKA